MKKKTLFFLSLLCFIPAISMGAEQRTLDVQFAFTAPSFPTKQLRGYRLYMGGQQVCATNDSSSSRISCTISTTVSTGNFTLKAYYSDGSESPSSPSFPLTFGGGSTPSTPQPPVAVVSSSTTAGNAPLTVSFNGNSSTDSDSSIKSYSWTFGDGTQASGATASHVYTTAGTYSARLTVVDNQGLSSSATTPIVVAQSASTGGGGSTDPDDPGTGGGTTDPGTTTPSGDLDFEVGSLSINHSWVRVLFENSYNQPIVIAGPPTVNGAAQSLVRIRNVNQKGFDIRIQEWDYLDGYHSKETVSYLVIEKGIYTLGNGIKMEAGSFNGSKSLKQVSLQQTYDLTPVIMTQVMTNTEDDAVTNRLSNINKTSFKHKLQEQEKTQVAHYAVESIGYIAFEPGMVQVDGLMFETSLISKNVDHNWLSLTYEADFSSKPFFFTGMQTTYGADTAAVRIKNTSQTGAQVKVEEEKSRDTETTHGKEVMGYFTIGAAK